MGSIPIVGSVYSFAIVIEVLEHNLQRVNASALWKNWTVTQVDNGG